MSPQPDRAFLFSSAPVWLGRVGRLSEAQESVSLPRSCYLYYNLSLGHGPIPFYLQHSFRPFPTTLAPFLSPVYAASLPPCGLA